MPQARSLKVAAGIMLFFAIPLLAIPMFAAGESENARPLASTAEECIVQANTQTIVDPYCHSLTGYIFDFLVGEDVYDARLEADWPRFLLGLHDDSECSAARRAVESLGQQYSDGTLSESGQREYETHRETANSWTCAVFRV